MSKKTTTSATASFSEQYKHPNWQKKRLEILERDQFTCQECGDTESTLHVHHKAYEYGKKPWDYNNGVFITLCDECHHIYHSVYDQLGWMCILLKLNASLETLGITTEVMLGMVELNPSDASSVLEFIRGIE